MSEAAKNLMRDLSDGPYALVGGWPHALPAGKRQELLQIAQELIDAKITLAEDMKVMDRDGIYIHELELEVERLRVERAEAQAEVVRLDEWINTYAYDKMGYKI